MTDSSRTDGTPRSPVIYDTKKATFDNPSSTLGSLVIRGGSRVPELGAKGEPGVIVGPSLLFSYSSLFPLTPPFSVLSIPSSHVLKSS